jgi:hypothetical protein
VIVHSVCGRFDIIVFLQRQPMAIDHEAVKAVAATIKTRAAAVHQTVGNASRSPGSQR